jgi:oligopeptidase A
VTSPRLFFDGSERLSRAWGIVGHLHAVMDVPEWREAYNANLPEVTRFFAELGQNLKLFASSRQSRPVPLNTRSSFAAQQRIVDTRSATSASPAPNCRKTTSRASRPSRRNWPAAGEVLRKPARRHQRLRRTRHDEAELAGMPADARRGGARRRREGWQSRLEVHPAHALLPAGDAIRRQPPPARGCCTAPTPRAPPNSTTLGGKPEWDNMPLIRRLLELRAEEAGHLGYGNFAEVSLVPKMAESPADVLAFLRELAVKSRPSPSATWPSCAPSP